MKILFYIEHTFDTGSFKNFQRTNTIGFDNYIDAVSEILQCPKSNIHIDEEFRIVKVYK